MPKQQIVIHRSPIDRRRFLFDPEHHHHQQQQQQQQRGSSHRLAEVAGGTTAECAAVVCCFPCTVVTILVLAVYKVPVGLCRKALKRKRRRRLLKNGLLIQSGGDVSRRISVDGTERLTVRSVTSADDEFAELENEMWEKFYGTGFWRSLSQRVD